MATCGNRPSLPGCATLPHSAMWTQERHADVERITRSETGRSGADARYRRRDLGNKAETIHIGTIAVITAKKGGTWDQKQSHRGTSSKTMPMVSGCAGSARLHHFQVFKLNVCASTHLHEAKHHLSDATSCGACGFIVYIIMYN